MHKARNLWKSLVTNLVEQLKPFAHLSDVLANVRLFVGKDKVLTVDEAWEVSCLMNVFYCSGNQWLGFYKIVRGFFRLCFLFWNFFCVTQPNTV